MYEHARGRARLAALDRERTAVVVANTLLSQGRKVRVLVRDAEKGAAWQAKGAEVAVADLHGDEGALSRAFVGAEGAYVLFPPLMRDDFLVGPV